MERSVRTASSSSRSRLFHSFFIYSLLHAHFSVLRKFLMRARRKPFILSYRQPKAPRRHFRHCSKSLEVLRRPCQKPVCVMCVCNSKHHDQEWKSSEFPDQIPCVTLGMCSLGVTKSHFFRGSFSLDFFCSTFSHTSFFHEASLHASATLFSLERFFSLSVENINYLVFFPDFRRYLKLRTTI